MTNTVQTTPTNLLAGIKAVEPYVSKTSGIEVLRCVDLAQNGSVISLDATDVSSWAHWESEPNVGCADGRFLLRLSAFKKLLTAMKGCDTITITEKNDREATITGSDGTVMGIPRLPGEAFPIRPGIKNDLPALVFDSASLTEAFDWTLPAVSRDETRPVLCGLCLETKRGSVHFVATDSYRLHVVPVQAEFVGAVKDQQYVIDLPGLLGVAKAVSASDGLWKLGLGDSHAVFSSPDGSQTIHVRHVDGQFPKYEQLVPEPVDGVMLTVNSRQFEKALETCAAIAGKNSCVPVRLGITPHDDEELSVSYVDDPDSGSCSSSIPCAAEWSSGFPSERFEAGFNPEFLLQVARLTKDPSLSMHFLTPLRPMLAFGADPARIAVLMPIRLGD